MESPLDDADETNYDLAIHLDAESLAEQGIRDAYVGLAPYLVEFGIEPREVTEEIDDSDGHYSAGAGGRQYLVSGPGASETDAWGLATHALFDIVNSQLSSTEIRFFGLNGGNDLFGIFMTPAQAERARNALLRKSDWPYLSIAEPPWFGNAARLTALLWMS